MSDTTHPLSEGLPLFVLLVAIVISLSLLSLYTSERRTLNRQYSLFADVASVLPSGLKMENLPDILTMHGSIGQEKTEELHLFPFIQDGVQHGVAITPITVRGYKGPISLLIGIRSDGRITGLRATSQQETPGLGDGIDIRRSDWMLGFNGKSLDNAQWEWREQGGDFDHLSGATITSRAVLDGARKALQFHRDHREKLYP